MSCSSRTISYGKPWQSTCWRFNWSCLRYVLVFSWTFKTWTTCWKSITSIFITNTRSFKWSSRIPLSSKSFAVAFITKAYLLSHGSPLHTKECIIIILFIRKAIRVACPFHFVFLMLYKLTVNVLMPFQLFLFTHEPGHKLVNRIKR